jgi:hypothetical protein
MPLCAFFSDLFLALFFNTIRPSSRGGSKGRGGCRGGLFWIFLDFFWNFWNFWHNLAFLAFFWAFFFWLFWLFIDFLENYGFLVEVETYTYTLLYLVMESADA